MTTATQAIALTAIRESKTNPRRAFAQDALDELTESIRRHGVLQPVLVRPIKAGRNGVAYELVAGARRLRASKAAELSEIPALVRELTDKEVLEVQVIENLQRTDLHPLEEAEGYRQLHEKHGYPVEDLAAKVGKSKAYVYARLKLCALTDEAKEAFLGDRITPGHAVLLARLKPEDQARALDPRAEALFTHQRVLFHPERELDEAKNERAFLKPRSVREFQCWIDENVRFDRTEVDQMVFPETAAVLDEAAAEGAKVVPITYQHQLRDTARAAERTFTAPSWKRADGTGKSKPCEHSVLGVVVAGAARGEAFQVCVAKKKCTVHWGAEQRASKKRAAAKTGGASTADREKRRQERDEGVSGKSLNRPAWQRVEESLRTGRVGGVVVMKLDRLSRSLSDVLGLVTASTRSGWALHSIMETLDTSTAMGRFFVQMLGALAELERGRISERVKAVAADLRRRGKRISGRPPFGYRFEGDEVVEEPVELELRARILELRGQGLGSKKIAARLNEESAGNPRTGRAWHYGTVAAILRNAQARK